MKGTAIINKELSDLQDITGAEVNECKCNTCQQMCMRQPCIGTPTDILNIIKAGKIKYVAFTLWNGGAKHGIPPIKMVQPIYDTRIGKCVFLDHHKQCTLHDAGLKPTEGKLQPCDTQVTIKSMLTDFRTKPTMSIPLAVALTWQDPANMPVFMEIINTIAEYKEQEKQEKENAASQQN